MPVILCPLCQTALLREEKQWRCSNGHGFDVAREGYVNLLPVQHKKSRQPGDAGEMVKARREFLAAGYYQPLRDAVVALLQEIKPEHVLDIGCGEGYYTQAMAGVAADVVGLDIAKPAIQMAAKRCKGPLWLVGSSAHLPLADASVDLVTSLFSPLPVVEMARVLRPGGKLLVVTPAAEHLRTVREALFETLVPHQPEKFLTVLGPQFQCVSEQTLVVPMALSQAALRQLLLMTPYVWRAKADRRAALEAQACLQTDAVFTLYLLEAISCKTNAAD